MNVNDVLDEKRLEYYRAMAEANEELDNSVAMNREQRRKLRKRRGNKNAKYKQR